MGKPLARPAIEGYVDTSKPALRPAEATGALLEEQNDEWAVGRRYFSTESMKALRALTR